MSKSPSPQPNKFPVLNVKLMSSRVHNIGPLPVGPYIPRTIEAINCKGLACAALSIYWISTGFLRFPRQKLTPAPLKTKATSKYRAKVLVVVVVVGLSQQEAPHRNKRKRNHRYGSGNWNIRQLSGPCEPCVY